MNYDTLFQGDFIQVISPKDYPYEAVLEKNLVWVIPIVDGKIGIRKELCPPYLVRDKTGEKLYYTLMSGTIEEGESPKDAALRELKEEGGIEVQKATITTILPELPICKVYASRATLLLIRIQEYNKVEITGDGTEYEDVSETLWVTREEIRELFKGRNVDMLLVLLYLILKDLGIE